MSCLRVKETTSWRHRPGTATQRSCNCPCVKLPRGVKTLDAALFKQYAHVLCNPGLHVAERPVIPGIAQQGQVGLGMALVAAFQVFRKVDITKQALLYLLLQAENGFALLFAQRIDHRACHVVERLGAPGAAIEHAGFRGLVQKEKIDIHHVVHMDEVTHLTAVGIAVPTTEETNVPDSAKLIHIMKGDRGHACLVLLVGPIHVEITQAHDGRGQGVQMAAQHLIEQELRVSIDVQRAFVGKVFRVYRPRPIHRRRRGINERDFASLTELEQFQCDAIVVVQHVLPVAFGGVRACPLMKDCLDVTELARGKPTSEIVLVHVIGNPSVHEVHELVALGQVVNHQNIGKAASVQPQYEVAADKAGASGHYDHASSPAVTVDVPNLPTTTPPARLAHNTASYQSKPAARVTASAASTVSPAPDTSNTSCV